MIPEYVKLLFRSWKYRLTDNPEEIRYLLHTIKKGTTAFDVGAHKGGYTFWMQKAVGRKGRVVAFEPQSKGARLLQELYGGTNVRVEHRALSDSMGRQELYIQPQTYAVSFEASLENKYPDALTELVETVTIDHYCMEQRLLPSFIKIDVEGHEEKVLQGAKNILSQVRPVLLVECEERHCGPEAMERLFHSLEELHYQGFFYKMGKRTPLEQFEPKKDQSSQQVGSSKYVNNFFFEPKR